MNFKSKLVLMLASVGCLLITEVTGLRIPRPYYRESFREPLRAESTGNANNFVDNVLQNFRNDTEFRNKVDPLYLDEIKQENIAIKDGVVRGLLSLHRSGDCSLDYEEDGEAIVVDCEMKVTNLTFTSNYSAKAMFFWLSGDIDASVEAVDIAAGFRIPSEGRPQLLRFQILELENIHIRSITGLSVAFNWLAKIIANFVTKTLKEKIRSTVEEEVRKFITKTLLTIDLPDFQA